MVAREVGGTGARGGRVSEEWGVVVRGEGRKERGEGGGGRRGWRSVWKETQERHTHNPLPPHVITPNYT